MRQVLHLLFALPVLSCLMPMHSAEAVTPPISVGAEKASEFDTEIRITATQRCVDDPAGSANCVANPPVQARATVCKAPTTRKGSTVKFRQRKLSSGESWALNLPKGKFFFLVEYSESGRFQANPCSGRVRAEIDTYAKCSLKSELFTYPRAILYDVSFIVP